MHGLNADPSSPSADFEGVRVEALRTRPLTVPLLEPFVIATGRVDSTRAVEVEVHLTWRGSQAIGLGEAACLPPVTDEDQSDVLAELEYHSIIDVRDLPGLSVVPRAAVETAVLDARARIHGVPVRAMLAREDDGPSIDALETDVTIAIAEPPGWRSSLGRGWPGAFASSKSRWARVSTSTCALWRPSRARHRGWRCGLTPTPATRRRKPFFSPGPARD